MTSITIKGCCLKTKEINMRGTEKSRSSKRDSESKPTIASLLLKRRSDMSRSRNEKGKRKSKSHVKVISPKQKKKKAIDVGSSKKWASVNLVEKKVPVVSSVGYGNDANGDVEIKKSKARMKRKKKKKQQKDESELDETSRLQRRTRYLLIKMKLEQNLIDAYSTEGWKGQSREKLRPEKELQRAQKQILKCKLGIRDVMHKLDSLSSVGSIADTVIAPDGSVYHEHIFCAKCKQREAFPDNDIILCDGTCNCAFHQKCLDPPLDTESIPPGDQGWFCKFCECKMDVIEAMNAHIGTHFPTDTNWQDIFKDEATLPDGGGTLLNPGEEWPSDDSADDDYDPERRENDHGVSGSGTDDDDDVSSSTSLSWSLDGEAFSGLEDCHDGVDSIENSDQTSDGDTVCGRRQRRTVDYKKLYAEMFGKDALALEQVSEDEDWGPCKRRRREKESDAISTLMTLYETKKKSSNAETTTEEREELPSDHKVRKSIFRLPQEAVERLRQVFSENELPDKAVRENLSNELGLQTGKVSKWFKNARYMALKARKAEGGKEPYDEVGLEARNNKNGNINVVLEDAMRGNLAPTEKNSRKGKNLSSLDNPPNDNLQYDDALCSVPHGNEVDEFSDDMILKKILKSKKKKRAKTMVGCSSQAPFEIEMERLCKAKIKLENMKDTLLRFQKKKVKKSNKYGLLEKQKFVMYVPIAELKEKV